jgi:uncharacterized membrane protein
LIAFLPFPTGLFGTYNENPLAVSLMALTLALASGLEVLQFRHAHRAGLMRERISPAVYRFAQIQSSVPAAVMLVSIPVAFLAPTLTPFFWMLVFPIEWLLDRLAP